ncbi:MAG TPA: tetratricopeptide repeat protein [Bryobacteraceae bacterium]|jgi:tetratricopeptide (TPR) repeat protein|nr:tetratricopeptide repeat protein [Bryobacteraceae bacterium]
MTRLIIFLAFAGSLLCQTKSSVEKAWGLAANGQREQAVSLLQKVIASNPNDADARLLLGSLFMDAGRGQEAIAQLTEAVKLRPRSAEAQNALGEAYNSAGEAKAAREPFEKAVAIKPDYGVAQMNLGEVLLNSGELAPASEHLNRAIKLLPRGDDSAYTRYLLAKLYTAQNDVPQAAETLQQAIAMRPEFPQAWSDLGEARKTLLDDNAALAAFTRAVELAPNDAVAQYRLGAEYLDMNKPRIAVEHLEIAYRLSPEDQSTLNALQSALRQDNRTSEADEIKQKLTELLLMKDKANQDALAAANLNNEGARLEHAGDLPDALKKYQAAVKLAPNNVPMRVNYAVALLRIGKWTDGLNELHAALLMDPSNAKIQEAMKEALAQAPANTIPDWGRR